MTSRFDTMLASSWRLRVSSLASVFDENAEIERRKRRRHANDVNADTVGYSDLTCCTRFGGTYNKIGTIQRRLAWPLRKDDTQIREAFHIFSLPQSLFSSKLSKFCLLVCRTPFVPVLTPLSGPQNDEA